MDHSTISFAVSFCKVLTAQEIVYLCAEHRYQPIKIACLLSLSLLNGTSGEISGAERTFQLFCLFWAGFWKYF